MHALRRTFADLRVSAVYTLSHLPCTLICLIAHQPCLSYNLLRLLDILRLSMVIELNISEWDDLPDLETVSGSDDEWEIEGVLGGGHTEVSPAIRDVASATDAR